MGVYRRGVVAHQVTFIRKGFVKIHRSIVDWEWYSDPSTRSVFLHLLFTANWKPSRLKNLDVAPGQCVTSIPSLAKALGLSDKNVRTALNHLKATGEVADQSAGWCRLVTIVRWEFYQNPPIEPAEEVAGYPAGDRQASGRQVAASEEGNNTIRERKKSVAPEARELVFPAWAGENTKAKWEAFKVYKREQHRFQYKSAASEQAAINLLAKYYTNGKICVDGLETAMAKGWMFPIDPAEQPNRNGAAVTNATSSYGREDAEAERVEIRLKYGKDPVWGGVDDKDKSRELLIYEGKIKP